MDPEGPFTSANEARQTLPTIVERRASTNTSPSSQSHTNREYLHLRVFAMDVGPALVKDSKWQQKELLKSL